MENVRPANQNAYCYYACETNKFRSNLLDENDLSNSVRNSIIDYIDRSGIRLIDMEPIDNPKLFKRIEIYRIVKTGNSTVSKPVTDGELIKLMDRENIAYVRLNCTELNNKKARDEAIANINKIFHSNNIVIYSDDIFDRNRRTSTTVASIYIDEKDIRDNLLTQLEILLSNAPDGYEYQLDQTYHERMLDAININLVADYARLEPTISKKIKFNNDFNDDILTESATPKPSINSLVLSIDDNGNIKISQKEYDLFDDHFRESKRLIKAYKKANNIEGLKHELAKQYYMAKFIEMNHMKPTKGTTQQKEQKRLLNLRSVMLNSFSSNLSYVTKIEPGFNFHDYFDDSKYSKSLNINTTGVAKLSKKILSILL